MAQRESRLSRKIMTELEKQGIFCFKNHGGPMTMAGLPDVIACVDGKFIGFETKTPEGGEPTTIQKFIHAKIRASGGEVFVPRSVKHALMLLRDHQS